MENYLKCELVNNTAVLLKSVISIHSLVPLIGIKWWGNNERMQLHGFTADTSFISDSTVYFVLIMNCLLVFYEEVMISYSSK